MNGKILNTCLSGKTVLITGVSGLLGSYLVKTVPDDVSLHGTWLTTVTIPNGHLNTHRLDITKRDEVCSLFEKCKPDVVIHCAAIGSVDYCQNHWQESYVVNVKGTQNILDMASYNDVKVVFISTNAVFDGEHAPYKADDHRSPINVYGKMKAESEVDVIEEFMGAFLVIRPIMLYGWAPLGARSNWATIVLDSITRSREVMVVDDTITQPTYAWDCASVIWKLLELGETGVYNVGGQDVMTLYEFARMVAKRFGLNQDMIVPIKSEKLEHLAPRPRNTTYCMDKLLEKGIKTMGVMEGLSMMREESKL